MSLDEEINAIVEAREIDRLQDYLVRGRAYARLTIEQLEGQWKTAFTNFAAAPDDERNARLLEDSEAEFRHRAIAPPDNDPGLTEAKADLRRKVEASTAEDFVRVGNTLLDVREAVFGASRTPRN